MPLNNLDVKEGQDVSLECTVSKPDLTAEWRKDGEVVLESERIKPKSVDMSHSLNIADVSMDDSAEYTCSVGGADTKLTLMVEGGWGLNIIFFKNGIAKIIENPVKFVFLIYGQLAEWRTLFLVFNSKGQSKL